MYGGAHTVALAHDFSVFTWGSNSYGTPFALYIYIYIYIHIYIYIYYILRESALNSMKEHLLYWAMHATVEF